MRGTEFKHFRTPRRSSVTGYFFLNRIEALITFVVYRFHSFGLGVPLDYTCPLCRLRLSSDDSDVLASARVAIELNFFFYLIALAKIAKT